MSKDNLGDRMKRYENVNRNYLVRRMPVIIRIDGKCFHTFTRGFKKPFDEILASTMQQTMKHLCENIMGCVLGYTQSDEISLVLIDYQRLESCGWFDYNIQKMASIAASMATMYFNKSFSVAVKRYEYNILSNELLEDDVKYLHTLQDAIEKGAMFDARAFNLPKDEVTNYFLWRQNDATRNAIEMVGRYYFSNKELYKKSGKEIIEMLINQKNVDFNDYQGWEKRGSCCVKYHSNVCQNLKSYWFIDCDIPVFKNEGRKYIDDLIYVGSE